MLAGGSLMVDCSFEWTIGHLGRCRSHAHWPLSHWLVQAILANLHFGTAFVQQVEQIGHTTWAGSRWVDSEVETRLCHVVKLMIMFCNP